MVMPEPCRNTCFKLQSKKKFSLVVHYALLVFTQINLGFVYTANYVCLNIKKQSTKSRIIKTYIVQATLNDKLTVVNETFY